MPDKIIGIDLGGTSVKFGILTTDGVIQDKWSIETNILDNGSHVVPDIVEAMKHRFALSQYNKADFIGIGMGSPGFVDTTKKTVAGAYNLHWKSTQEVGKAIIEAIGLPFAIDNDANVAALGERWIGAGKNSSDVIFMTLGTGVGGGIIVNSKLVHGAGSGGEIGHIIVEPEDGFVCTCGLRGCLETVASATGVVRVAQRLERENGENSKIKVAINNAEKVSSKDIFEAAITGDNFALSVVEKVTYYLGLACGNLANTLNPDSIIIGGGVSMAGEFLRKRVESYFFKFTFPTVRKTTKIKLATLGNDAGIIGAASLALKCKGEK